MSKRDYLLTYAKSKQDVCIKNDTISDNLFKEYGVNRGLRDVNGKGVLTGLTNVSKITSFKEDADGNRVPCDGELWYRGYNVKTLIDSFFKTSSITSIRQPAGVDNLNRSLLKFINTLYWLILLCLNC